MGKLAKQREAMRREQLASRHRKCETKLGYSLEAATAVCAKMRANGSTKKLSVYYCDNCKKYHIGRRGHFRKNA